MKNPKSQSIPQRLLLCTQTCGSIRAIGACTCDYASCVSGTVLVDDRFQRRCVGLPVDSGAHGERELAFDRFSVTCVSLLLQPPGILVLFLEHGVCGKQESQEGNELDLQTARSIHPRPNTQHILIPPNAEHCTT